MNNHDEGLGWSVSLYLLATFGVLALLALPVSWALSPTVYQNPGVTAAKYPGGPAYASRSADFPLAVLQSQQIVNPAMLAELNAKSTKAAPVKHANRSAHRSYAQARDIDADDTRPARRSFFSLF